MAIVYVSMQVCVKGSTESHCLNAQFISSRTGEYTNSRVQCCTLKNAGLNTTQRWVKCGQTQLLGCFDPAVGLKCPYYVFLKMIFHAVCNTALSE